MPDRDGYSVCYELKSDLLTEFIPVIFVTSKSDAMDEAKGFAAGGVDYIAKPFSAEIVGEGESVNFARVNVSTPL